MSMRTPVELRNDAWECLQQAEQAPAQRDKAILLILAQGWASLADEMERLGVAADATETLPAPPLAAVPPDAGHDTAGAN
jgi:hypothetical protein